MCCRGVSSEELSEKETTADTTAAVDDAAYVCVGCVLLLCFNFALFVISSAAVATIVNASAAAASANKDDRYDDEDGVRLCLTLRC